MMKIAEMYRISGGTEYRYLCNECKNCKPVKRGHICLLYQKHGGEGLWKPQYIACKYFNLSDIPGKGKKRELPPAGEQMSLFDLIGGKKD